jgi:hypothetical protein
MGQEKRATRVGRSKVFLQEKHSARKESITHDGFDRVDSIESLPINARLKREQK